MIRVEKKFLYLGNLYFSGNNVRYCDFGYKYLFIGMVRWEGFKFLKG